jgi:hypothetical protein
VREDHADPAVLEPSDFVGGSDTVTEDGHEVPGGGRFSVVGPDFVDDHGKFLSRPVGAVTFPVENGRELPVRMDAIEAQCVANPARRIYTSQRVFHTACLLCYFRAMWNLRRDK